MKMLGNFWLFLSFVFVGFAIIFIINLYVTLKYEIEEPKALGRISHTLIEKEKSLRKNISLCWMLLALAFGNILLVAIVGRFNRRTGQVADVDESD